MIRAEYLGDRVVAYVEKAGLRRGIAALGSVACRAGAYYRLAAAHGDKHNIAAADVDMFAFYLNSHLPLPPFNAVQDEVKLYPRYRRYTSYE